MNTPLTVSARRRRLVDSAVWALLTSLVVLYCIAPMAGRVDPSGTTLVISVYFYAPVLTATMMIAFSWFGFGTGGLNVVENRAWAALFIPMWLALGLPDGRGVLWLSTMSVTYLLCERLLPEPAGSKA